MTGQSWVDPAWHPPSGVWIRPIDGWGYAEHIDGKLATEFEIAIDEEHVDLGGVKGWRAHVTTPNHKYSGMPLTMTPRHTEWTGIVVANVRSGEQLIFSGMAETSGLEYPWND